MLFKQASKDLIRDGSITMTFRNWQAAQVVVGHSYRLGPADAIIIKSVEQVAVRSITLAQAQQSGFANVDELLSVLSPPPATLAPESRVFRIAFRHEHQVDPRTERREDASADSLKEVEGRLARMDRLSRRGPWTISTLQLIDKHPQVAASRLAPHMQRETPAFKADVRKLKELGLTLSHEVGYSLSHRGRALLHSMRR